MLGSKTEEDNVKQRATANLSLQGWSKLVTQSGIIKGHCYIYLNFKFDNCSLNRTFQQMSKYVLVCEAIAKARDAFAKHKELRVNGDSRSNGVYGKSAE